MKSILHKGIDEMKRLLSFPILVLLLYGCSSGIKIEANESTFLIGLRNHCDCEIYKVHHEYYIGEKPAGGGDMNGIKLLFPEIAVKIVFAAIGIIHGVVIWKYLLPKYTKAFHEG